MKKEMSMQRWRLKTKVGKSKVDNVLELASNKKGHSGAFCRLAPFFGHTKRATIKSKIVQFLLSADLTDKHVGYENCQTFQYFMCYTHDRDDVKAFAILGYFIEMCDMWSSCTYRIWNMCLN